MSSSEIARDATAPSDHFRFSAMLIAVMVAVILTACGAQQDAQIPPLSVVDAQVQIATVLDVPADQIRVEAVDPHANEAEVRFVVGTAATYSKFGEFKVDGTTWIFQSLSDTTKFPR